MTMTATYSPEDNKLRLYSLHRLDDETYQRIKKAGFKWAYHELPAGSFKESYTNVRAAIVVFNR